MSEPTDRNLLSSLTNSQLVGTLGTVAVVVALIYNSASRVDASKPTTPDAKDEQPKTQPIWLHSNNISASRRSDASGNVLVHLHNDWDWVFDGETKLIIVTRNWMRTFTVRVHILPGATQSQLIYIGEPDVMVKCFDELGTKSYGSGGILLDKKGEAWPADFVRFGDR